jgi:hypothetical protein
MGACLDKKYINDVGQLNYNQDGSISVFMPSNGVLAPVILNQQCCLVLDPTFTWDADMQKCMWSEAQTCSIESVFDITLNPNGNDGVIFTPEANKECFLKIDFDYLLKIKCDTLNDIINTTQQNGLSPYDNLFNQFNQVQSLIDAQTVNCQNISDQIISVQAQIDLLHFSVEYYTTTAGKGVTNTAPSTTTVTTQNVKSFSNTGFGSVTPAITSKVAPQTQPIAPQPTEPVPSLPKPPSGGGTSTITTYCITDPDGMSAWANILGPTNYQLFLNGDPTSYTQADVQLLIDLNTINNFANGPTLLFECNVPFGSVSNLQNQLSALFLEQENCQTELAALNAELINLSGQLNNLTTTGCTSPINMLETLDMSMTLNVLPSSGGTQVVYEDTTVFPSIGIGMLYSYLINVSQNTNIASGFYITDNNGTPLMINGTNDFACSTVLESLLQSLYTESPSGTTVSYDNFLTTLPNNAFASDWLHHTITINDPNIIDIITGQKITINLRLNHTCGDVCILLDNVKLERECSSVTKSNIFVTQSPGFELEKIRDNKKTWLKSIEYQERPFDLRNVDESNPIRITNYDVNDERLVINTKEIDLDISLASAIETDVWCYIVNNPCILTGQTYCDPCGFAGGYKQFQDDFYFEFQDSQAYDFMDGSNNQNTTNTCCGDNLISFDSLMTQPLSAVTTVEDFEYFVTSELIDAKNRQTISGYPTLRALYDRYLNSEIFCGVKSSSFDYLTIDQFAGLVGNYWVDIIEQVIPSTTIWGSVKVYSNTMFDQQKFKYKGYSSLFCDNPFFGEYVVSPINGTSGDSIGVHVDMVTLTPTSANSATVSTIVTSCDAIWVAQMNSSNEFIGTVSISGGKSCNSNNGSINECTLQVDVVSDGTTVTANVIGAVAPITYEWGNGSKDKTTTYDTIGTSYVTVTDANCCSVTVQFEVQLPLTACWYTLPDTDRWITRGFSLFGVTEYVYSLDSMIVNGVEYVIGSPPTYTLNEANYNPVSVTAPTTQNSYTNFVDFLNQAFINLGLTNYSAQLADSFQPDADKYLGFYIIRPVGDTFNMYVTETNNTDTIFTENSCTDTLGGGGYRYSVCDGITVVNGHVVE